MKKKNEEEEQPELELPKRHSIFDSILMDADLVDNICCVYGPPPPDEDDIDIINDGDDDGDDDL